VFGGGWGGRGSEKLEWGKISRLCKRRREKANPFTKESNKEQVGQKKGNNFGGQCGGPSVDRGTLIGIGGDPGTSYWNGRNKKKKSRPIAWEEWPLGWVNSTKRKSRLPKLKRAEGHMERIPARLVYHGVVGEGES